jgi:hypothetical protein
MSLPTFASYGGEIWLIRRFAESKVPHWSAFNPSIAYSPEQGYWAMFRSSNYYHDPEYGGTVITTGGRVKSNIWMAKLSSSWQIIESSLVKIDFSDAGIEFKRGAEDARLYWRNGAWEFIAGLHEDSVPLPRLGIFRLDTSYKARLVKVMNDGWLSKVEKNWMTPYEKNLNFDYIYNSRCVYIDGCGPVQKREMHFGIKGVRGGSPLWKLEDGTYLAIIHRAYMEVVEKYNPKVFGTVFVNLRHYTHCFVRYSNDGTLIQISPQFYFKEFGIEFAAGLVVKNEDVVVSFGYRDVASYLGKIKLSKVMELLSDC